MFSRAACGAEWYRKHHVGVEQNVVKKMTNPKHIAVLTLFPTMFEGVLGESILKLAIERGLVTVDLHNLRDWGIGSRHTVDDRPYGGGPGMVLRPEPVFAAVEKITGGEDNWHIVLLTPQGRKYTQSVAAELAGKEKLLLVCGHYEGFDERIRTGLPVDEISAGDYVTTGGEIPAMIVIDTVVRQIPGALGNEFSTDEESFSSGLLEYPHYTRPPEYRGMKVPEILLSGNHAEIAKWRKEQSDERTRTRRPDLLRENDKQ
jgi:tRNA (guanine37-N1)-methyltransferase